MAPGRRLDRRAFLLASLAAGACATTPKPPAEPLLMRDDRRLGIQLYSLGPDAYRDLPATFAAIAQIGYKTVQMNVQGDAAKTRAALDASGLACTSLHTFVGATNDAAALDRAAAQAAAFARTVGASYVVTSVPPLAAGKFKPQAGDTQIQTLLRAVQAQTPDDWKLTCDTLNAFAQRLQKEGVGFAYHNHNFEFAKLGDGRIIDTILTNTDPALVKLEIDVGWIAAAGLDPQDFIAQYPDRARLMHIKDIKATTEPNFELKMDPSEVGRGTQNWRTILDTAIISGVEHFYVEQEPPFAIPEFEAARFNFNYLTLFR